ncbi:MAG: hypothetical protein IJ040_06915 [Lachnospiraceae bacterium]|nr:hypothetical protein [Lachnospiraceae bacterium]
MLGKLIKHEFEATRGGFLLLYGITVLLCLLCKPLFYVRMGMIPDEDIEIYLTDVVWIYVLCLLLGLISTIGVILSAVRFYQSMTCDEAYLTFTLPATSTQIFFSKVFVGFVWNTGLTALGVLGAIAAGAGAPIVKEVLPIMWADLQADGMTTQYLINTFVNYGISLIIANWIAMTLLMFVISIGQLFGKYRLPATVGTYFLIQGVGSVVICVAVVIVVLLTGASIVASGNSVEIISDSEQMDKWILIGQYAYYIVIGTITTIVPNYIFKKKLNLA